MGSNILNIILEKLIPWYDFVLPIDIVDTTGELFGKRSNTTRKFNRTTRRYRWMINKNCNNT